MIRTKKEEMGDQKEDERQEISDATKKTAKKTVDINRILYYCVLKSIP